MGSKNYGKAQRPIRFSSSPYWDIMTNRFFFIDIIVTSKKYCIASIYPQGREGIICELYYKKLTGAAGMALPLKWEHYITMTWRKKVG